YHATWAASVEVEKTVQKKRETDGNEYEEGHADAGLLVHFGDKVGSGNVNGDAGGNWQARADRVFENRIPSRRIASCDASQSGECASRRHPERHNPCLPAGGCRGSVRWLLIPPPAARPKGWS